MTDETMSEPETEEQRRRENDAALVWVEVATLTHSLRRPEPQAIVCKASKLVH